MDLKDAKYEQPVTPGVGAAIDGIVLRTNSDTLRLDEGGRLLDSIFERFRVR